MDSSLIFGPQGRFATIMAGLCRAVAASLRRGVAAAVIVLAWGRVRRVEARFLALVERVRSGRYRGGWVRRPRDGAGEAGAPAEGDAQGDGASDPRGDPCDDQGVDPRGDPDAWRRLPRRFAWLVGLVGYQAAGYASQLTALLAEPEMVALLRDVPQARRILQPLCRMLGIVLADDARARASVSSVRSDAVGAELGGGGRAAGSRGIGATALGVAVGRRRLNPV